MKCNIPFDELKADAEALLPLFDKRTTDESNHFSMDDIDAGLKGYRTRAFTCTINFIERVAGIQIKRNKRNYKKQKDHLFIARGIRDLKIQLSGKSDWREGNGRPIGSGTKEKIVTCWKLKNPEGRKAQCIRETGLSKMTVALEQIADQMDTRLFNFKIRECTAIKEAQAQRESIFSYDKKCNAVTDYEGVLKELLKVIKNGKKEK